MNRIFLSFTALGAVLMSSCSAGRSALPYFADIETVAEGRVEAGSYLTEIKPDDELLITVNTYDPSASAPFNMSVYNPGNTNYGSNSSSQLPLPTVVTNVQLQTYMVDTEGCINFPQLGRLHVAGMNVEQLQKMLTERISRYVDDPIVNVRIANFDVVVAGEVLTPKKIRVNRNRYSILDALSDAGDLTPYGERSKVLLVREKDGKREYHRLNLNSSDLLSSPYFYLQQNDYVYVEPNRVRQDNSKYNQNNAYKLSVISTVVSASSVVASLVIALAIK